MTKGKEEVGFFFSNLDELIVLGRKLGFKLLHSLSNQLKSIKSSSPAAFLASFCSVSFSAFSPKRVFYINLSTKLCLYSELNGHPLPYWIEKCEDLYFNIDILTVILLAFNNNNNNIAYES